MKIKTIHFETLDSTNEWAKRNLDKVNDQTLLLVTAGSQTAGRGRDAKTWHSPPECNFYGTFCACVPGERHDLGMASLVLALSACKTLEEFAVVPMIKWPNDLLVAQKKIGGLLGESIYKLDKLYVILGLGLNINMSKEEAQKIDQRATSLTLELGFAVSLKEVRQKLADRFSKDFACFLENGFEPFMQDYKEKLTLKKGQKIQLYNRQAAIFEKINPDGTLLVALPSGENRSISSGIVQSTE